MICLALGLGILGFAAMRHARRYHCYAGHGYHGHDNPWGGNPWHHHWRNNLRRRGLYMALSRIDATPAQERAIVNEVEKFWERIRTVKANAKDGHGDLAAALRSPVLDDAALGAWLGRLDSAAGEARAALLEALRNVHGVLDDKQREQVADMIDRDWWRRGGSPYRV